MGNQPPEQMNCPEQQHKAERAQASEDSMMKLYPLKFRSEKGIR
jgi:hypothetical protein